MKSPTGFAFLIFISQIIISTNGHPFPEQDNGQSRAVGAAYFATNELNGNFIISNGIGQDGKLSVSGAFSTGGVGSRINVPPPDPLSSQGSVTVSGNNLYVVNAGSNTVTMFSIDPRNPTSLRQIGKPVNSGGEFPVSIAASEKTGLICVLNAGRVNGVSCYKQVPSEGLVSVPNTKRPLGFNQTTPPDPSANNRVGQVIFNEAETQLIVSLRVVGVPPRGALAIWDINPNTGALSKTFREVDTPGALSPFGMTVLPGKNAALAADPAFGYDIFDLNRSSSSRSGIFNVPNQGANCWAVLSKTGNVFLVDPATDIITEVAIKQDLKSSIIAQHNVSNGSGVIDAAISMVKGKEFLHVLAPNRQSVVTLALGGPGKATVIQELSLTEPVGRLGRTTDPGQLQGMAVFTT